MSVFGNYCIHTVCFRFNTDFCLQETNGQVCLISYYGGICHSRCQKPIINAINKISTMMILMSVMWHAYFSFNLKTFLFMTKYPLFSSSVNCLPLQIWFHSAFITEKSIRMQKHRTKVKENVFILKKWRWKVLNFPAFRLFFLSCAE